jgi:hypothetical protein
MLLVDGVVEVLVDKLLVEEVLVDVIDEFAR